MHLHVAQRLVGLGREVGFAGIYAGIYAGFASQVSTQASMLVLLPHALLGSGRCALVGLCAVNGVILL